jgi:hypothetical protein
LSFAARVLAGEDASEAYALAHEVLSTWKRSGQASGGCEWLSSVAVVFDRLGKRDELVAALPHAKVTTPWLEAASAYAAGDFTRSAEIYEETGAGPDAAYARLRAAESFAEQGRRAETDAELESALAFWRAAGATAYVRQGEALLAESA